MSAAPVAMHAADRHGKRHAVGVARPMLVSNVGRAVRAEMPIRAPRAVLVAYLNPW